MSIATSKPPVPEWVHNAVFYEIYPQTFCDSNGDGIGDLQGIISKLDYVKSLGVDGIWLNPFYKSPMRDAGYDVADFCAVDPRYGTNEDARRLFAEAKKRGLRVLVDFVPGHTSVDHPWFQESCKPTPNPYSNWYIWTDCAWYNGGDEWKSKMIHGYCDRNGNYLINFFWSQPALNFGFGDPDPEQPWQLATTHPDVQRLWEEMKKAMEFWMELGASGFRVDMAGSITRRDKDSKEARRFWAEARERCEKINPDYFTVAEWSWPINALDGKGLHADFLHWIPSYEHLFRKEPDRNPGVPRKPYCPSWFDRGGKGNIAGFIKDYLEHYEKTLGKGYVSIPVSNHDLPRLGIDRDENDLEIIFAFLLTMPGVPFIYYGDEIGMRHLMGLSVKEGCYPPRTGARTPMQWDGTENLGFSTGPADKLWMPVDPAPDAPHVAAQEARADSLLNKVRKLITLRRTEPALTAYANFRPIYCEENAYPFIFLRENGAERALIVINPAARPFEVCVDGTFAVRELLAGQPVQMTTEKGQTRISGSAASYSIVKL
ncbi:MAG: alpha-amylase family glycosyl hydrolase [Verrucomicrobiota bacterium]|nr:alpha-amylase family glycosyl hydrolase [Verrucomicrobiota bacterium]